MVWKMYLLSNMAILGSYVRFQGCTQIVCFGAGATHLYKPRFVVSHPEKITSIQVKFDPHSENMLGKYPHLLRQNWTFQWIVGCT